MEEIKKNKIFLVVFFLTILNLSIFIFGKILVEETTNRVIERLKNSYSPSPYGPGFDPDKIDATVLNRTHGRSSHNFIFNEEYQDFVENLVWRKNWESERGFSLSQ